MTLQSVQQDYVGLPISYQVLDEDGEGLDISDATIKKIILQSPVTETTDVKDASWLADSGASGWVTYTTVAEDLFEAGQPWLVQAYIVQPSRTFFTEVKSFQVKENLVEADDEDLA